MAYAEKTDVPVEKSRNEIERTLNRYGASSFMYGTQGNRAVIAFAIAARQVKFIVTLPDLKEDRFQSYMQGRVKYQRAAGVPEKMWEQACRQKWRALALVIKAKLEAVDAGITTIEDEFLAHTVLPDGQTVGQVAKPMISRAYETGQMPNDLLMLGGPQ